MPKRKKAYPPIQDSYTTGRFTREEVRAAVLAVKAEREAAEKQARAAARGAEHGKSQAEPRGTA